MSKLNFNKKILFALFIGLIFIMPVNASEYIIEDYDVQIKVNENNTLDVTERITANFLVRKHGIYRYIPIKGKLLRDDNVTTEYKARIKNLHVSDEHETSIVNDNVFIKIGDPDLTITGQKSYDISYTYSIGKDLLKDKDELYYNIVGNGWDTTIENLSFKITMPKDFDSSKFGFSRGLYGTANSSGVDFTISGNIITGSAKNLSPNEAVTARCELEEGYFVITYNKTLYLFYLIPLIFMFLGFILWKKYGKDDIVVNQVEFYPPEGLSSLDVAFCYNGSVNSKDVVSLIIYLANKGYLSINEDKSGSIFRKDSFTLVKLKDYDGDNIEEKIFFSGLFNAKRKSVSKEDLQESFYKTMNAVVTSKNKQSSKDEIFEKESTGKVPLMAILLFTGIASIVIKPFIGNFYIGWFVSFVCTCVATLFSLIIPLATFSSKKTGFILKVFSIIVGIGIFLVANYLFYFDLLFENQKDVMGYIFGSVCLVGITLFLGIMPKRTPYGTDILGKINGFKSFLETAEKEKLEMLVTQDPSYFYNILPYTYVLGISDKWIKKFESIAIEPPQWYDGTDFNYIRFTHFVDHTMTTANTAMVSTPTPSGDSTGSGFGGFTGGGFSGGGFGGGGGGSW